MSDFNYFQYFYYVKLYFNFILHLRKLKFDRITTKKTTQRDMPQNTVNKLIWNPEKCAGISWEGKKRETEE